MFQGIVADSETGYQDPFGTFAFGDIAQKRKNYGSAYQIADTDFKVDCLPVLTTMLAFKAVSAVFNNFLNMSPDILFVFQDFYILYRHTQQFVAGIADYSAVGFIHIHKTPLHISDIEPVQCCAQQLRDTFRRQFYCLVGPFILF